MNENIAFLVKRYRETKKDIYFTKIYNNFYSRIQWYTSYYHQKYFWYRKWSLEDALTEEEIISTISEHLNIIVLKYVDINRHKNEISHFINKCINTKAALICATHLNRCYKKKSVMDKTINIENVPDTFFVKSIINLEFRQLMNKLEEILIYKEKLNNEHNKINIRRMIEILKKDPKITKFRLSKEFNCSKTAIKDFYNKMKYILTYTMEVKHVSDCISTCGYNSQ